MEIGNPITDSQIRVLPQFHIVLYSSGTASAWVQHVHLPPQFHATGALQIVQLKSEKSFELGAFKHIESFHAPVL